MKYLNEQFTEEEMMVLKKAKGKKSWREFILSHQDIKEEEEIDA